MVSKSSHRRVSAVIAAYNEGPRIAEVLRVLCTYNFLEVIVVNDGSTDDTLDVINSFPVKVIHRIHNAGKGQAMDCGVRIAKGDIIFFCDADIYGLTHAIIDEIVEPVLSGRVIMMIGMRNRTIYFLRWLLHIIPLLGGERAVVKCLWETIPPKFKEGFMIEAALNYFAYRLGGYDFKVFKGLSQTIKEDKYGFFQGLYGRAKMIYEVLKAQVILRFY